MISGFLICYQQQYITNNNVAIARIMAKRLITQPMEKEIPSSINQQTFSKLNYPELQLLLPV